MYGIPRDHHFLQIYDCVRSTKPPVYHVMFMSGLSDRITYNPISSSGLPIDESVPIGSLDCMCFDSLDDS